MRGAPAAAAVAGAPPFPWDAAMAAGLGRLGLAPADFWRMTPRELAAEIRPQGRAPAAPPDRAALEALMRRFPDATDGG